MTLPTLSVDLALTPVGAAVIAEILTLWMKRYLADWRWQPLLLLFLSIGAQIALTLAFSVALERAQIAVCAWNGFLGASIATFGQETLLNILGRYDIGPRGKSVDVRLGRGWM